MAMAVFAWCSVATGHQDTIIKISRSGHLSGLPESFQPARLIMPSKKATGEPSVSLQLGPRIVEFPPCISRLFYEVKKQKIRVTASWYHDSASLPYYLVIRLPHERAKYAVRGWSLLIALETAKLLELRKLTITNGGYGQSAEEIDVASICSSEEIEQLLPRDAPSNNTLKLPVRPVTVRASARSAPGHPAA